MPYLIVVAYVAGWFRSRTLGVEAGLARLDDVVWLPFFYQYYAPYTSTMYSAMIHAALYAPVGVACWLWAQRRVHVAPVDEGPRGAARFVAEMSKVFLAGRLPDYTDVLIAAVSATVALAILGFASRSPQLPQDAVAGPHLLTTRYSRCDPSRAPRHSRLNGR